MEMNVVKLRHEFFNTSHAFANAVDAYIAEVEAKSLAADQEIDRPELNLCGTGWDQACGKPKRGPP